MPSRPLNHKPLLSELISQKDNVTGGISFRILLMEIKMILVNDKTERATCSFVPPPVFLPERERRHIVLIFKFRILFWVTSRIE